MYRLQVDGDGVRILEDGHDHGPLMTWADIKAKLSETAQEFAGGVINATTYRERMRMLNSALRLLKEERS